MRIMQRAVLILAVMMLLFFGVFVVFGKSKSKLQNQWEILQTERFIEKICRREECSYEEYALYHAALNYSGSGAEIELEEYQKEKDMTGGEYYYMISWSEIQEKLFSEGTYYFNAKSVVVVSVKRTGKAEGTMNKYYDIVSGKD